MNTHVFTSVVVYRQVTGVDFLALVQEAGYSAARWTYALTPLSILDSSTWKCQRDRDDGCELAEAESL